MPRLGDDQAQMEQAHRHENHAQLQHFGPEKGLVRADVLAEMKHAQVPERDRNAPEQVNAVQRRTKIPPQHQQRQCDIEQRRRQRRDPDDIKRVHGASEFLQHQAGVAPAETRVQIHRHPHRDRTAPSPGT